MPYTSGPYSTQLMKNLYLSPERSVLRKAREAALALRVEKERLLTKDEILVCYYEELGYRPFKPEEQRCKLSIFRRADLTVDRVTKVPLR